MVWGKLIIGGVGLSVGAGVVEKLPANATTAGVKSGLASAGSFLPVMGTLGGASMAVKQVKKLKFKEVNNVFRI